MNAYAGVHACERGSRSNWFVPAVHPHGYGSGHQKAAMAAALEESNVSRAINTSFVERQNGTDRHRNARKARKTYRFSEDCRFHESVTYLTMYVYNFCWPVRTLRIKDDEGCWQKRSPAMTAGLADHVWSISEWLTFPAVRH
jgi:hypothetical protein